MAIVVTCPKCGYEFNPKSLAIKDPHKTAKVLFNEIERLIVMGIKETCPKCGITSTLNKSMFEWKSDS